MFFRHLMGTALSMLVLSGGNAPAAENPVVLELFTSQSCSSCPVADAFLKRLKEEDASLLVLSYHVDYWDHLNWKDTYSSPANTRRQQQYNATLRQGIFTPQLVVNGTQSAVGSQEQKVKQAIGSARQAPALATVSITPEGKNLSVTVTGQESLAEAELLEVRFDNYAQVQVESGENRGRMLESVNSVTAINRLGAWTSKEANQPSIIDMPSKGGVAILVQLPDQGRIVGAASYP